MRKEKVISNYGGLSDDELSVFAGKVVQSLTDNPNFTTTVPPFEELQALAEEYRLLQEVASRGGSKLDRENRNETRGRLLAALSQLAHFVNVEANGSLAKLVSSGLIPVKHRESTTIPGVVQRIRLREGQISGQIRIEFDAQKYIWEYEIQIGQRTSVDGAVLWGESFFTTSSRSNVIGGLTPANTYYVRVRARNAKGLGDWSDYMSIMVR